VGLNGIRGLLTFDWYSKRSGRSTARTQLSVPILENQVGQQEHYLSLVRRHRLEAANFYAETLPDSAVKAVHRAPGDYPAGKQGDVLTVET